jgi:NitT/TauT family transport system substrate-binding protein
MSHISRSVLVILISLLLMPGCSNTEPDPGLKSEKLTVGAYAGDTGSLVFLAQELGLFKKHGIKVEIREFEAGKLAADALLKGDVDIATSAGFVFVSNVFKHRDLQIMGTVAKAESIAMVARRDRNIHNSSDLRGKRIGVTRKSTGEYFLGVFLTLHGVALDEVSLVNMKPSMMQSALSSGEVDAVITWDPNVYRIKQQLGENAVSWSAQGGQDFNFLLLSTGEWLQGHPQLAANFLQALLQAESYMQNNPGKGVEFIGRRFKYDNDYTRYIWDRHDFRIAISQSMISSLEAQARWALQEGLVEGTRIPNVLDHLYTEGLDSIYPDAVTLIR